MGSSLHDLVDFVSGPVDNFPWCGGCWFSAFDGVVVDEALALEFVQGATKIGANGIDTES